MNVTGWSLIRFMHVLCAMVWVGGQLLLSGIVFPVLRSELPAHTRGPLIHRTARRFAIAANVALLPMLGATGIARLAPRCHLRELR